MMLFGLLPQAQAAPPVLYGHITRQCEGPSDTVSDATTCTRHCGFRGTWNSITEVTGSTVEGIVVGEQVTSQVRFAKLANDVTVAVWAQTGWSNNCSVLNLLNGQQAQVVRENEGLAENAGCREVSFDEYTRTGHDEMLVFSKVRMYVGESFAGCYTTRSFLHRVRPDGNLSVCHDPLAQQN